MSNESLKQTPNYHLKLTYRLPFFVDINHFVNMDNLNLGESFLTNTTRFQNKKSYSKSSSDKLKQVLLQQLEFYKTENARNESFFDTLGIQPSNLAPGAIQALDRMVTLQMRTGCAKLDAETIAQAVLDHEDPNSESAKALKRMQYEVRQNHDQLKCVEQQLQELKLQQKLAEKAFENVGAAKTDQSTNLTIKREMYVKELEKLQKKAQAMDCNKYNLITLNDKLEELKLAKQKNEALQIELDKYQGLEPNLQVATNQLAQLKTLYKSLNNAHN